MKAIVFTEPGRLRVAELPEPSPGRGEVRVRVKAGSICSTDLDVFEGLMSSLPRIAGHHVCGVVEELGEGVSSVFLGRRVTIDPAANCRRTAIPTEDICLACMQGMSNLCEHRSYMGITAPGAFAEHVVVPVARVVRLPDEVDDVTATVLEPVVIALRVCEQVVKNVGTTLVLGAGPIGLATATLLEEQGHSIIFSDPVHERRVEAVSCGFRDVRSPATLYAELAPHVIVEASGHPSALATIEQMARPGSMIVLVGGITNIPGRLILGRELEVRAVKGGGHLYRTAAEMARRGQIEPGSMVSHIFPARDAAWAFSYAAANRPTILRSVLNFQDW